MTRSLTLLALLALLLSAPAQAQQAEDGRWDREKYQKLNENRKLHIAWAQSAVGGQARNPNAKKAVGPPDDFYAARPVYGGWSYNLKEKPWIDLTFDPTWTDEIRIFENDEAGCISRIEEISKDTPKVLWEGQPEKGASEAYYKKPQVFYAKLGGVHQVKKLRVWVSPEACRAGSKPRIDAVGLMVTSNPTRKADPEPLRPVPVEPLEPADPKPTEPVEPVDPVEPADPPEPVIAGSPELAVADFYYGLIGDDTRYDRCADWPSFCANVSARSSKDGVTPEEKEEMRSPAMVKMFKDGIRTSVGNLAKADVKMVVDQLKVSQEGEEAIVTQPGGARFLVKPVDGRWRIYDMLTK